MWRASTARWPPSASFRGTRRTELAAITETMHQIAISHQLTASRLPALFATLAANEQWWTTGPLLSADERVEFAGSQLVWEYYPGQGIQLQVLGSFGKADGLYTGGPADYPARSSSVPRIIPLASSAAAADLGVLLHLRWRRAAVDQRDVAGHRAGGPHPRYQATGDAEYLNVATQAMPSSASRPRPASNVRTARDALSAIHVRPEHGRSFTRFLQT